MLMKLMKYPTHIVRPEAKPRVLCGYSSTIIENGKVRKPRVLEKMKAMSRKAGNQLNAVSFKGCETTHARLIMLRDMPAPLKMAGGRLPNLSEKYAMSSVVKTRVNPM